MINRRKTQRLDRQEGVAGRRRRSRRQVVGNRASAPALALPNQCWSLNFVHDQMASGRWLRVLNVVDNVTRVVGLNHSQKTTAAARLAADRKFLASLS